MDENSWIFVAVLAVLVVLASGAQLWAVYGADFESPTYLRDLVLGGIAERLNEALPRPKDWLKVALLPCRGDEKGVVAATVARRLEATGSWRVLDREWQAELLAEYKGNPGYVPTDADDALRVARKLGVDAVIFGTVEALRDDAGAAECSVKLDAYRTDPVARTASLTAEERIGKSIFSFSYYRACLGRTSGFFRGFVWCLWLLTLPFMTYPLTRDVFLRRSNVANAGLLVVFVALAAAGALLLSGFHAGWTLLGAVVVAAVYDFVVLDRLEEIE